MNRYHPTLNGFFIHGVPKTDMFAGSDNDQLVSDCIFCGKENKFYANILTRNWDCKVCGASGSFFKFLELVHQRNMNKIKDKNLKALANERELPVEAFQNMDIGFDGSRYTFPIYNYDGTLKDLRHYVLGNKVMSTPGAKLGLFRAETLAYDLDDPVYLLEGEWDTIAMNWLIKTNKRTGLCIGVPGANTFKDEWTEWFVDRNVFVMYDNDDAGKNGEITVHSKLDGVAKKLYYVHWPSSLHEGYDVNDYVSFLAIKRGRPKKCYRKIHEYFHKAPRLTTSLVERDKDGKLDIKKVNSTLKPISYDDLISSYRKLLYFEDPTPIKVTLATVLANRIGGSEPIWMFMVGRPSGAKSELITALSQCAEIEMVSKFTPQTLVSGFITGGKKDTSLLPKLQNRIMAIKDFTVILNMVKIEQDKIFGLLRDAYDGRIDVMYGHGINRRFKVNFGILAGVVTSIERIGMLNQSLGERFLRYNMPDDESIEATMNVLEKAAQNSGNETTLREDLSYNVKRFLEGKKDWVLPEIEVELIDRLKYLAWFMAKMRGVVEKDYKGHILFKPQQEAPTRIFKQLLKFIRALAMVEGKKEVGVDDYDVVKRIAVSTCPSRVETIIRSLHRFKTSQNLLKLSYDVRYPPSTVKIVLDDLVQLRLVQSDLIQGRSFYTLTPNTRSLIRKSLVYPRFNISHRNGFH